VNRVGETLWMRGALALLADTSLHCIGDNAGDDEDRYVDRAVPRGSQLTLRNRSR
jgi:hypothetical protein